MSSNAYATVVGAANHWVVWKTGGTLVADFVDANAFTAAQSILVSPLQALLAIVAAAAVGATACAGGWGQPKRLHDNVGMA